MYNLYVLKSDNLAVKIGISKNLKNRINTIQGNSPSRLYLWFNKTYASRISVLSVETQLHNQLAQFHMYGEWFRLEEKLVNHLSAYFNTDFKVLPLEPIRLPRNPHIIVDTALIM